MKKTASVPGPTLHQLAEELAQLREVRDRLVAENKSLREGRSNLELRAERAEMRLDAALYAMVLMQRVTRREVEAQAAQQQQWVFSEGKKEWVALAT